MDWIAILAILTSLILAGFLSGIEIAFATANNYPSNSVKTGYSQRANLGRIFRTSRAVYRYHHPGPEHHDGHIRVTDRRYALPGMALDRTQASRFCFKLCHVHSHARGNDPVHRHHPVGHHCRARIIQSQNNKIIGSNAISYIAGAFYGLLSSLSALFVNMSEWILKYVFNVKIHPRRNCSARRTWSISLTREK